MLRVITMLELSQGVCLAWRLAAGEAARTMHPRIEKECILIGLCDLGRWLRSKAHGEDAPLKGPALRAVSAEAQTIEAALKACAVATDLVCQAVRTAVWQGPDRRGGGMLHRSPACTGSYHSG